MDSNNPTVIILPNTDLNDIPNVEVNLIDLPEVYQTNIQKAVFNREAFKIILDLVRPIDFEDIVSDGQAADIRRKLAQTTDSTQISVLQKRLKDFTPSDDEKRVIIIEDVSKKADQINSGLIAENGSVYFYDENYWKNAPAELFKTFLSNVAEKAGIKKYKARVNTVKQKLFDQFLSTAAVIHEEDTDDGVKINLTNGTYHFGTGDLGEAGELKPANKEDRFKYKLPYPYIPDAKAPLFERFLNKVLPDKSCQNIVFEYLAYILTVNMKLEKMLFLYGSGANGKSVFFEIVRALFGSANICSYSMEHLLDEAGYYRAKLGHYLVNYCSELGSFKDMQLFKKMASGEPIDARLPYGEPFILTKYAKFIFNANVMPDFELTPAYFRRLIIVPFKITIPKDEQDINLHRKIIESELSGIFNLVIEGLKRLRETGDFTYSAFVESEIESFKKESDNVHLFLEAEGWQISVSNKISLSDLYSQYRHYAQESGYRSLNTKNFSMRLKNLGYDVKRGNQGYTYVWCDKKIWNDGILRDTPVIISSILETTEITK